MVSYRSVRWPCGHGRCDAVLPAVAQRRAGGRSVVALSRLRFGRRQAGVGTEVRLGLPLHARGPRRAVHRLAAAAARQPGRRANEACALALGMGPKAPRGRSGPTALDAALGALQGLGPLCAIAAARGRPGGERERRRLRRDRVAGEVAPHPPLGPSGWWYERHRECAAPSLVDLTFDFGGGRGSRRPARGCRGRRAAEVATAFAAAPVAGPPWASRAGCKIIRRGSSASRVGRSRKAVAPAAARSFVGADAAAGHVASGQERMQPKFFRQRVPRSMAAYFFKSGATVARWG
mmetsp:Transcript_28897/g.83759  ORF Transcript_28897/g.83759 Transcript_28897/m.83759 type:complete len:292 (+) Transcript_28897:498-1373(+)